MVMELSPKAPENLLNGPPRIHSPASRVKPDTAGGPRSVCIAHAALPRDVAEKILADARGHAGAAHLEFEVNGKLLDRPDAAELLRRASTR